MTLDHEELGRRLRAMFVALQSLGTHEETVALYERERQHVSDAETVDPAQVGSWGWWAKRILDAVDEA